MSTYVLISSNTLSSSAASVTFSSIPSTYTDLVLKISARSDSTNVTNEAIDIKFNGTTTGYSWTYAANSGGTAVSGSGSGSSLFRSYYMDGGSATTSTFANIEIYIPSYTASQNKPMSSFTAPESNTASIQDNGINAGLWQNTAAITSLVCYASNGAYNFVSGSSFYLYGIKSS